MSDESDSVKEARIRAVAMSYYSRKDVEKAIYDFCRGRETVPRYFEGFGKRPNSLEYPSEILALVKNGATSFHCSEERWKDVLGISSDKSSDDFNELREGWDLCIPDFEKIFIKDKGLIRKITLKELSQDLGLNSTGRFTIKKDIRILSINPHSYKIEEDFVRDLIIRERKIGEKLIRIVVDDGKELSVSEDHPVLVFTKNGIEQKAAKNLEKTDFLLTPLKIDLPEFQWSIDIIELLSRWQNNSTYKIKYKNTDISRILVQGKNFYEKIPAIIKNNIPKNSTPLNFYLKFETNKNNRKFVVLKTRRSSLTINPIISLDYDFGKLVGYYLSEGSVDKDRLEFTFHKNEVKEAGEVISLFNKVFNTTKFDEKIIKFHKTAKSLKVRINSKILCLLFKETLGFSHNAHKKRIPDWVYNSPKDFVRGLMTSYFIGDGCCIYEWNNKSLRINALTVSRDLIDGLSTLFLKLGIPCNITRKVGWNSITVSGEEGIRIFSELCEEFIKKSGKSFINKKINHPSKHSLYPPYLDINLINAIRKHSTQSNLYRSLRLNYRINKGLVLLAANNSLTKVIENNLFPIKIKSIEKRDYEGLFYDIETKNNHNFLHGDGIFTHNCIDIDSKYFEVAKYAAISIVESLEEHGIKNLNVKFSGGKGFHIIVPWEAFPKEINGVQTRKLFPSLPRLIVAYLMDKTKGRLEEYLRKDKGLWESLKKSGANVGVRCENCKNISSESYLITLTCPNRLCRTSEQIKKTVKEVDSNELDSSFKLGKKRRCTQCSSPMEESSKTKIYYCEECKVDSVRDKNNFSLESLPDIYEQLGLDVILVSPRHLFRAPYSLHEKTSLVSVVIDKSKILSFTHKDADPMRVIVKNFLPVAIPDEAKRLVVNVRDWSPPVTKALESKDNNSSFDGEKKFKEIVIDRSKLKYAPVIDEILKGIKGDGRKRALFILINYFKSLNFSEDEIKKIIVEWDLKNAKPLREGYVNSQLSWSFKQKKLLPPNYDKPHYKGIGINPTDEELKFKNPVSYTIKKMFSKGYSKYKA